MAFEDPYVLESIRGSIYHTATEISRLRSEVAELKECLQMLSMVYCVQFHLDTCIYKDQLKEMYDRFIETDGDEEGEE